MSTELYKKEKSLKSKHSASLLSNNLTVQVLLSESSVRYGIVHKTLVDIVTASLDGSMVTSKQIYFKDPSVPGSSMQTVMQAKWVTLGIQRTILVITAQRGIQFFEPDGTLLFWHNLTADESECTSMYMRGIAAVGSNFVCVGSHTGEILYFKVPLKGKTITYSGKISEHKAGICCLTAADNLMASCDMEGNIFLWKLSTNDVFVPMFRIPGYRSPCSTIAIWNECIVGGYGSGHLRVFCAKTGALAAEVAAHTRWINAVDIAPKTGLVLSAGEDSFVRLWYLSKDPFPQISVAGSQYHVDSQIVGSCFVQDEGKVIACTAYDKNEILFLVSS
ncbi:repeat-containing 54-like [Octopus vulgaris]|uniref:Repeat-containing 54-like n=2 Tax=Octopus TaxID=6643 RepID=A0AA36AM18_OCTVU|nr:WD repeat-containing protein 54 [Octopus sinensis]CAI9718690.1 repeat-containing 54-like [Octopus vulgaris]